MRATFRALAARVPDGLPALGGAPAKTPRRAVGAENLASGPPGELPYRPLRTGRRINLVV